MPRSLQHRITRQFAGVLLDTSSIATSLAIGVAAAQAAWTFTPDHWFGDLRIIAAGALCVAVTAGTESLLTIILGPLRSTLWVSPTAATADPFTSAPPVAETSEEGMAQLTAATIADAAHRAAIASWSVDHGAFLNSKERWRGYANGDATFYLAPGAILHCQFAPDHNLPKFTLLTSKADFPVKVSTIRQVLDHLVSHKREEAQANTPPAAQAPEATVTEPAF
ncbi:hypothetical protein [Streptomyces sp. NBC_01422]|uniref:hypothetical protein n=1 Tax=Streptomyces sp. NBC_01422 TaxID=2903859 RepID=UPI002E2BC925|nr:hypothetical protein [Streptomyces sp. NBC_01422]